MKLKYYLRGLGIGIMITTVILAVSFGGKQADINDIPEEEIIAEAAKLGMVMKDGQEGDAPRDPAAPAETEEQSSGTEEGQSSGTEEQTSGTEEGQASGTEGGASEPADAQAAGKDGEAEPSSEGEPEEGSREPEEQPPYRLTVKPGNLCSTVGRKLEKNGVIDDSDAWCAYMTEQGYASLIKAGSYDIPYDLTYEEIADILKKGPIRT